VNGMIPLFRCCNYAARAVGGICAILRRFFRDFTIAQANIVQVRKKNSGNLLEKR
jgi:hypothetical protein